MMREFCGGRRKSTVRVHPLRRSEDEDEDSGSLTSSLFEEAGILDLGHESEEEED